MINIWAVWPTVSVKRSRSLIGKWQDMGYDVAVLVNPPLQHTDFLEADWVIVQQEWKGFPTAANILCREVPGDVVVVVGDDVYPEPKKTTQEIGQDFLQRFPDLLGVMQPTGDIYGRINQCAVSPWIGRKFIQGAYGGKGPYWEEYFHYFSDQELQEYAIKMKAFQQRPDLSQYHDHWGRQIDVKRPKHLHKAKQMWQKDKTLFEHRKAAGFPSCPSPA